MSEAADALKGLYFPVLDHGFVALVDYMGDDAAIVQAARVSYGAGTKKLSEDRALVRYLRRHAHTTPYEMVELKFHVKLPIFVARQLIRHRTASVNEYSMRYSLAPMQFYTPKLENMGTQSKKNKQGRAEPVTEGQAAHAYEEWAYLQERSKELYEYLIREDVDLARELARIHLPLNIYTEWYWKIDLHNLLGFLKLRVDKHAQWEIRQVGHLKACISSAVAPHAMEAWSDYTFQSKTFSRMEMQLLRSMLAKKRDGASPPRGLGLGVKGRFHCNEQEMQALGMGEREIAEFLATFEGSDEDPYAPIDLSLDLTQAKTGAYFEEQAKLYLPKAPAT